MLVIVMYDGGGSCLVLPTDFLKNLNHSSANNTPLAAHSGSSKQHLFVVHFQSGGGQSPTRAALLIIIVLMGSGGEQNRKCFT